MIKAGRANGKEVHVRTVNDLQTALPMIVSELANIITDRPAYILDLLRTWSGMTDGAKIAFWLRNSILEDDPALVSDL
jgi:hypothetical protein